MILIIFGILFGLIGVFVFKRAINDNSKGLVVVESLISSISFFWAIMLIPFGFLGIRITDGEHQLKSKNYVTIQNKEESKYEVFDGENNILYYFEGTEVEILKDSRRSMYGDKIMYECTIIEGNYSQPYVEEYQIDYKMNFWSFELANNVEYVLYVPQNMTNE